MADALDDAIVPEIRAGIYRHYKTNNEYEVIGVALHSETLEPMVIYKPLYETKVPFWVRPYKMFIEEVIVDSKSAPRFKKIKDV